MLKTYLITLIIFQFHLYSSTEITLKKIQQLVVDNKMQNHSEAIVSQIMAYEKVIGKDLITKENYNIFFDENSSLEKIPSKLCLLVKWRTLNQHISKEKYDIDKHLIPLESIDCIDNNIKEIYNFINTSKNFLIYLKNPINTNLYKKVLHDSVHTRKSIKLILTNIGHSNTQITKISFDFLMEFYKKNNKMEFSNLLIKALENNKDSHSIEYLIELLVNDTTKIKDFNSLKKIFENLNIKLNELKVKKINEIIRDISSKAIWTKDKELIKYGIELLSNTCESPQFCENQFYLTRSIINTYKRNYPKYFFPVEINYKEKMLILFSLLENLKVNNSERFFEENKKIDSEILNFYSLPLKALYDNTINRKKYKNKIDLNTIKDYISLNEIVEERDLLKKSLLITEIQSETTILKDKKESYQLLKNMIKHLNLKEDVNYKLYLYVINDFIIDFRDSLFKVVTKTGHVNEILNLILRNIEENISDKTNTDNLVEIVNNLSLFNDIFVTKFINLLIKNNIYSLNNITLNAIIEFSTDSKSLQKLIMKYITNYDIDFYQLQSICKNSNNKCKKLSKNIDINNLKINYRNLEMIIDEKNRYFDKLDLESRLLNNQKLLSFFKTNDEMSYKKLVSNKNLFIKIDPFNYSHSNLNEDDIKVLLKDPQNLKNHEILKSILYKLMNKLTEVEIMTIFSEYNFLQKSLPTFLILTNQNTYLQNTLIDLAFYGKEDKNILDNENILKKIIINYYDALINNKSNYILIDRIKSLFQNHIKILNDQGKLADEFWDKYILTKELKKEYEILYSSLETIKYNTWHKKLFKKLNDFGVNKEELFTLVKGTFSIVFLFLLYAGYILYVTRNDIKAIKNKIDDSCINK